VWRVSAVAASPAVSMSMPSRPDNPGRDLLEILRRTHGNTHALDPTGSYRAAAELCGCSHHTVKKAVDDRNAGLPPATQRARMIDDWRDLLESWFADSKGKIRDKAHDNLVVLGYTGTDRTTRRALAEIKMTVARSKWPGFRRYGVLDDLARADSSLKPGALRQRPKISIIMPTYNIPAPMLCAAINSVLSQIHHLGALHCRRCVDDRRDCTVPRRGGDTR
jgi:hypothetical protein